MLTKEIIGKLTDEQQELLAQMEFRRQEQRRKLLELARGQDWRTRYFPFYILAVFLVFIAVYYFNFLHIQAMPAVVFLPLGVPFVFTVFAYQARTNRRLDALLELLDFDREQPEHHGDPNAEKAG